jgi:16S rRNA processing protein RimM
MPLSDDSNRFEGVQKVWLTREGAQIGEFDIVAWRFLGKAVGVRLRGIETPEAVLPLRGAHIEAEALPADSLPENTYFVFDLIGMRVESDEGAFLGTVADVISIPAHDLLAVRDGSVERLIPIVSDHVKHVDVQARIVIVHVIPGLLDL